MRVLVWQWGRRGAGPRIASELARGLNRVPGTVGLLSLARAAEILAVPGAPANDLPVSTYTTAVGLAARVLLAPVTLITLVGQLRRLRADVAVCAMPGPIDLLMALALAWTGTRFVVIVHDADSHPGEDAPLLMWLQKQLLCRAGALVALSSHVAERLRMKGFSDKPIIVLRHPPMAFGDPPPSPFAHGGDLRLLFFGRLLAYKGLDLLGEALALLDPKSLVVRVIGSGPDSEALAVLSALPFVTVENRWVAESEIAEIIAWADALVLPYREASQSGAAAVAVAAGRWVVATDVGGLREQLSGEDLAIIVDPDAAGVAQAIRHLCQARPIIAGQVTSAASAWQDFAKTLIGCAGSLIGERR
jgi:glycosyltransferase involved in cell wall biosynthesis